MSVDNNVASWTSAQLVADVKRKARIPTNSTDWTTTAVLRECSDQLWTFVAWAQTRGADGRLVTTYDRSVAASLPSPYRAAGEFLLPPLAVGDTIQSVKWIDSTSQNEYDLSLTDVSFSATSPSEASSIPTHYSLLADRIRVYPSPNTSGTIRFNYPRRHPELCDDTTALAPVVNSVSDPGGGYTRFTLATSSPFVIGQYVDLVNNQYPYRTIFSDLYCGATAGSTVDLYIPHSYANAVTPASMRLVRAGQLPYVQLPLEFRTTLTWKVAAEILVQVGDMTAASAAESMADKSMDRVLGIITRRDKSDRVKVINHYSLARAGMPRRMRENRFP